MSTNGCVMSTDGWEMSTNDCVMSTNDWEKFMHQQEKLRKQHYSVSIKLIMFTRFFVRLI